MTGRKKNFSLASSVFSETRGLVFRGLSMLVNLSKKLADTRLEFRRFPSAEAFDIVERSEDAMAGDATTEEAGDATCALEQTVFAFFEPLARNMANGESVDQRELAVDAERRLG